MEGEESGRGAAHRVIRRHRVEGEVMWLVSMAGLAALARIALRRRRTARPARRAARVGGSAS